MSAERYARHRDDTQVLAAPGARLARRTEPVAVRLPREPAEAAVAVWERAKDHAPGVRRPSGRRCGTGPPSRR